MQRSVDGRPPLRPSQSRIYAADQKRQDSHASACPLALYLAETFPACGLYPASPKSSSLNERNWIGLMSSALRTARRVRRLKLRFDSSGRCGALGMSCSKDLNSRRGWVPSTNLCTLRVYLSHQIKRSFLPPPSFQADSKALARGVDFLLGNGSEMQRHAKCKVPCDQLSLASRVRLENPASCRSRHLAFVKRSRMLRMP